ncbi:bcl-2-interacting killer isoform X1 [Megalops cyprinoides]|uniref:bcl-2-interacting killer isoform X1 n=2 Tax=Megalops cyprinoides TaxID=118141 RepID=UPI001864BD0B|nr:bcl-2-interacting killer isoform X1 [Megalops cyprinoides]XP_036374361.1 bcl-2-interacting killer isoform X1 [Megalops cyprinoides]
MKMELVRELSQNFSVQAGPGDPAKSILSDMDLSIAQNIGRQLAEIGDQLNLCYHDNHLILWPHPLHMVLHVQRLSRNLLYRGVLDHHMGVKSRLAGVRAWLTFHFQSQVVRRAEGWRTWILHSCPPLPYGWAAGLLATALLATVAVCIDF